MFQNSSIMVMVENNEQTEIYKLETDRKTQISICQKYFDAYKGLCDQTERIVFDGKYKPDEDEILYINNYDLDVTIKEAVENPAAIPAFIPADENKDKIKAILVGEVYNGKTVIVFQKFKKEQYINVKGINLFFDRDTFVREKRFGISISDEVDCIYEEGELIFKSFYMARQIFNLMAYYREATSSEVDKFTQMKEIELENTELFKGRADSIVRKKIASIMDSKILKNYSAQEIRRIGKKTGVDISVKDKKVVIPADKKQMKIVLGFLDEEVYKGVFSNDTFITNSKRTVS